MSDEKLICDGRVVDDDWELVGEDDSSSPSPPPSSCDEKQECEMMIDTNTNTATASKGLKILYINK